MATKASALTLWIAIIPDALHTKAIRDFFQSFRLPLTKAMSTDGMRPISGDLIRR